MGVSIKDLKCSVPLPRDKTFPWIFFPQLLFFFLWVFIAYSECQVQCLLRKAGKQLNKLKLTLYTSFNPKETLPTEISGIYSQLSFEGTRRCVSVNKPYRCKVKLWFSAAFMAADPSLVLGA